MQIDDLVPPLVSNYDKHGAMAELVAVLHQRSDAAVHLLPHPIVRSVDCLMPCDAFYKEAFIVKRLVHAHKPAGDCVSET